MEILIGQVEKGAMNGIGRRIVLQTDSNGAKVVEIFEGFFGSADNSLQFGRIIDNDKCQFGMFKMFKEDHLYRHQLHGRGKRINPNQILQQGYFDRGKHIQDEKSGYLEKDMLYLPHKINWNDYFSQGHHMKVMRAATKQEKQA